MVNPIGAGADDKVDPGFTRAYMFNTGGEG